MAHFFLDISFLMGGYFFADMAELADALDLGSSPSGCRFDSCYPHFLCTHAYTKQIKRSISYGTSHRNRAFYLS